MRLAEADASDVTDHAAPSAQLRPAVSESVERLTTVEMINGPRQVPPKQTPASQPLPSTTGPKGVQTGAPLEQVVRPWWQALAGGTQLVLATHEVQLPEGAQTRFAPHGVPASSPVPVSVQLKVPVEQVLRPWWQTLSGGQLVLATHALQLPEGAQTRFAPHGVPASTSSEVSVQSEAPVEQLVAPRWQMLPGRQPTFAVQATQAPAEEQTWLVPQAVPASVGTEVSTHAEAPVAQLVAPWWQGLLGAQVTLAVHAAQVPLDVQT